MLMQFFISVLVALFLLGGVANGQGSRQFQQGPQLLKGGITGQDQWLQLLQNNMANQGQQVPKDAPSMDKAGSKAKNFQAPKVIGTKQPEKRPIPKPASSGFSTPRPGMKQVQRPRHGHSGVGLAGMGDKPVSGAATGLIGTGGNPSSSHNSTSFLDGYLLRSLHDSGLAHKKPSKKNDDLKIKEVRGEDKDKDNFSSRKKITSKF